MVAARIPFVAFLFLLCCGTSTCAGTDVARAAPPVDGQAILDLDHYMVELERWSALLSTAHTQPTQLDTLRQSLPKGWWVEVSGQRIEVSTAWLDKALQDWQQNPDRATSLEGTIQARFEALRAEAEALRHTASSLSEQQARAQLEAILRQRQFRAVRGPTWIDRWRERVGLFLAELLESLLGRLSGYPEVGTLLLWVVIALAMILLALWLKRALARGAGVATAAEPMPSPPRSRDWRNWLEEGRSAACRGAYRLAVRSVYWAAVYRLEELGAWKTHGARTHREYLRLLPADHALRAPLAQVTERFERIWYGGAPASEEDFRQVASQVERLEWPSASNPVIERS
jgi:hypothetical protein